MEKAPFPLQERQPACSLPSCYKIEEASAPQPRGPLGSGGMQRIARERWHVAVWKFAEPGWRPCAGRPSWMVFLHGGVQLPGMPWLGPACPDLA